MKANKIKLDDLTALSELNQKDESFSSLINKSSNGTIKTLNKQNKKVKINPLTDNNSTKVRAGIFNPNRPQTNNKSKSRINTDSKTLMPDSKQLAVRGMVKGIMKDKNSHELPNSKEQANFSIHSRLAKKMRQGKIDIDKTIDLHSYFQKQAQDLLMDFLSSCHRQNLRNVLIITGKGQGKLRSMAQKLFLTKEVQTILAGYFQAPPKLGGEGAYIVRLRRNKNHN